MLVFKWSIRKSVSLGITSAVKNKEKTVSFKADSSKNMTRHKMPRNLNTYVCSTCPPPVQLVNHCLALDIDPEDQIEKQIMFEESKRNPTDYASVDDITLHRDEVRLFWPKVLQYFSAVMEYHFSIRSGILHPRNSTLLKIAELFLQLLSFKLWSTCLWGDKRSCQALGAH